MACGCYWGKNKGKDYLDWAQCAEAGALSGRNLDDFAQHIAWAVLRLDVEEHEPQCSPADHDRMRERTDDLVERVQKLENARANQRILGLEEWRQRVRSS